MKTELDLQKIRTALEEQQETLIERLNNHKSSQNSRNPDRSYLALAYVQNQRNVLLLARAERQLTDVNAALERIKNGEFGKCESCGQNINAARLEAMPTTASCMKCQLEK